MTTFTYLPYKNTDTIDWTSSLSTFLTSTFGRSFTSEISPSFQQFDKLRKDIEHATIKDAEKIIPIYFNYLTQLDSLKLRLPMDIVLASNDLAFSWTDVFGDDKHEKINQKSLSYEKASVLFNLASLNSYLGVICASLLNWKLAILHFSNASGILEYMSKHFLHAPTNDLNIEITKGFSYLMLAQAQECFLFNYMQSPNIKHSLASRLSEGVSLIYNSAYNLLANSNTKSKEFENKANYFHNFALFHSAENYMELTKIGYAIPVFKTAMNSINSRIKFESNQMDEGLLQLFKSLQKETKEKIIELEKDNDLIYHQSIVEGSNIPTIKPMDGVKIISLDTQLKNSGFKDLFAKIVPMEAHKGMSIYSEKQAQVLRDYNEKIEISNEKVKSFFEFSKLPNCVIDIQKLLKAPDLITQEEDREKEDEYPRVLAMAHELESSLDLDYSRDMQNVQYKRDKILKLISEAEESLVRDDKNMLIKGLPSNPELVKLRDEVSTTRKILTEAGISDSKLSDLWKKYEVEITVLRDGTTGVQKWLNENENLNTKKLIESISLLDIDDDINNSDELDLRTANHLIDSIYQLKKSLELLMSERNSTLKDLKTAMHNEDISSVLIKYNGASPEELDKVFTEELQKYESYTSRIDGLVSVQDDKILELKDLLNRLLDLKIIKKKIEEKKKERSTIKAKLTRLVSAYDSWKLCLKGINEALEFYTKLLDRTSLIINRINDLVSQRENIVDSRQSISSATSSGFGGYTMNIPQFSQQEHQQQMPPPSYSNTINARSGSDVGSVPPLPTKPNYTGGINLSNQPYTTPSVYDPNMYSQFGQNWKQ
jgi:hypothetical protein